ncbi:Uncharacterized protein Rs2_08927 [Raphanus sativus]|nr:Uncharacterized protein Rs2_08927 [Raphanus sativus]
MAGSMSFPRFCSGPLLGNIIMKLLHHHIDSNNYITRVNNTETRKDNKDAKNHKLRRYEQETMVSARLIDADDSSEDITTKPIPELMFAAGEEPVGIIAAKCGKEKHIYENIWSQVM